MPVISFPRPIAERITYLEANLIEIRSLAETLALIDQVPPPSAAKRRQWQECIVTLHGYLNQAAHRAWTVMQEIK
jgi:hypothetical protein